MSLQALWGKFEMTQFKEVRRKCKMNFRGTKFSNNEITRFYFG